MKTSFLLPALLSAALTVTLCAASPDELRAEAEKLVEKAKQAKAEGRGDEAQELMSRVKKIQGELREQLAAVGGAKGDGAKGGEPAAERARREAEQMRRQIEELHRAGQHDEAQQLEKKFAECNGPRGGEAHHRRHHSQSGR